MMTLYAKNKLSGEAATGLNLKKAKTGVAIWIICGMLSVGLSISCETDREQQPVYIDLSNHAVLDSPETLIEFEDTHPVWLTLKDSTVFIIQVQTEFCMAAFNLKTKDVQYFGRKGNGPGEFVSYPDFIEQHTGDVLLIDNGSTLKKVVERNGTFSVENVEYPYRRQLNLSGAFNLSDNFIVAYSALYDRPKMFYIYNKNTDSLIYTDFYPEMDLESSTHPFINSIYAPSLGLNEKKNRIIAGMYHFDMFHVYDLSGRRINSFRFSDNYLPKVETDDWQRSVDGFIPQTFPTENYCYLNRITKKTDDTEERMIIQVDWDGKLINTYRLVDNIEGFFYIDEKNGKMYTIRNYLDEGSEEVYALVTYDLKE